jgi:molecular chaperone DnaK
MHVSAKEKTTGKEQKIIIKASSGLTEEEIKRMVADAEAHAEEDKKVRELVESRNRAEQLMHGVEKTLKDLGDKVDGAERAKVESAISDLRTALKGDDKAAIDKKLEALMGAAGNIAQQAQAAQAGGPQAGEPNAGAGGSSARGNDDAVDAEFEEVKDDKKQA